MFNSFSTILEKNIAFFVMSTEMVLRFSVGDSVIAQSSKVIILVVFVGQHFFI